VIDPPDHVVPVCASQLRFLAPHHQGNVADMLRCDSWDAPGAIGRIP